MQRVHFQVRSSRCFQLSTNLGKDFFRCLWYCDKKNQIECGLAWRWWKSTDLGLIDMFLINLNAEIVALVYYYSENRATSQIWKVLPNIVFPPIWEKKMAAFWACACKLPWTLLSSARVQPLYGAGGKESPGTGLAMCMLRKLDLPRGRDSWCWPRRRTACGNQNALNSVAANSVS